MADLRTMAALGAYGMGVVTNVVAQNTVGVRSVTPMPTAVVRDQLESVSSDVIIDGIKIGMLGSAETISVVREWLQSLESSKSAESVESAEIQAQGNRRGRPPVVLDPVMISTSGTRLLEADAVAALLDLISSRLIDVVTPNIPELAALLGEDVPAENAHMWERVLDQATRLSEKTSARIYAKAGHLTGSTQRSDALVFSDPQEHAVSVTQLPGVLVDTKNTHGTGCTLSSALAVFKASGKTWEDAARAAKKFMNGAIEHADDLAVGHGHGPIDQLWNTIYLQAPLAAGVTTETRTDERF
jgi:hydroxymethylpyrimidine kinase/phosphomethylpyrimidine kinase